MQNLEGHGGYYDTDVVAHSSPLLQEQKLEHLHWLCCPFVTLVDWMTVMSWNVRHWKFWGCH
jgi:hypothetical protein